MAFNLKQNPVMMMGKHTSCQFPAATHFRICRLPIRFQETIFSKPLYFTQPNFLIGLTGLSPGSGKGLGEQEEGVHEDVDQEPDEASHHPREVQRGEEHPGDGQGSGQIRSYFKVDQKKKLFETSQVKWLVPHTMTVMELARLLKLRLKVAPRIDILLLVRHFDIFKLTPFQKQFG